MTQKNGFFSFIIKRNKALGFIQLLVLALYLFTAVFADFIANDKPIYCNIDGRNYFPVIRSIGVKATLVSWDKKFVNAHWDTLHYNYALLPPIAYHSRNLDPTHAFLLPPFYTNSNHWLGTGPLGEDILAGLIYGTRYALIIGVLSILFALIIGSLIGIPAGYFGDNSLTMNPISFSLKLIIWMAILFEVFFILPPYLSLNALDYQVLILILLIALVFYGVKKLDALPFIKKLPSRFIPLDNIFMRTTEIFDAIPKLLLLLALISFFRPSLFTVILLIAVTSWTGLAFFIRTRIHTLKNLPFIEQAIAIGLSPTQILIRHLLPNVWIMMLPLLSFLIAEAILAEAALSFLGLGLPPEYITWGKMLSMARETTSAWWILLFPGLSILILVLTLNTLGKLLTEYLSPKGLGNLHQNT